MQRIQRCRCSIQALEAFTRDFAGLDLRRKAGQPWRQPRQNPSSNIRSFSTTRWALDAQQQQQQKSLEHEQSSTITTTTTTTIPAVPSSLTQTDEALPEDTFSSSRSRVDSRKQRKLRRVAAKKAEKEEAKREAVLLKNRKRRERKRLAAAEEAEGKAETVDGIEKEVGVEAGAGATTTTSTAATGEEAKTEVRAKRTTAKATKTRSEVRKTRTEARNTRVEATKTIVEAATEKDGQAIGQEVVKREREQWQIQKAALNAKFGEQKWNPRKRISPDALAGIRSMHKQQPTVFTTALLAEHFKVSPEAIRRILKSKWQPDEEAIEDRRKRWEKRGSRKWSEMVELGIRPPKKWREMGIGRVGKGETPTWKKGREQGRAGERWIEHPETDSFVMAGDVAAEEAVAGIGDRIV